MQLHEMLKDESEDEEDQLNFELDSHLTEPISMDASHKHRAKIRDQLAETEHLGEQDRH